jgi:hypothetical protein
MKTLEQERKQFLENRIERLENCVHELEVTAVHYYSPEGKSLKGWNTLLGSRDKVKKLIEDDYKEIEKL